MPHSRKSTNGTLSTTRPARSSLDINSNTIARAPKTVARRGAWSDICAITIQNSAAGAMKKASSSHARLHTPPTRNRNSPLIRARARGHCSSRAPAGQSGACRPLFGPICIQNERFPVCHIAGLRRPRGVDACFRCSASCTRIMYIRAATRGFAGAGLRSSCCGAWGFGLFSFFFLLVGELLGMWLLCVRYLRFGNLLSVAIVRYSSLYWSQSHWEYFHISSCTSLELIMYLSELLYRGSLFQKNELRLFLVN